MPGFGRDSAGIHSIGKPKEIKWKLCILGSVITSRPEIIRLGFGRDSAGIQPGFGRDSAPQVLEVEQHFPCSSSQMAAGMIGLSMDPLYYARPPAELHAPHV